MDLVNVQAKFEVHSFTISWGNSDWSFRWGCETKYWGGGIVPFERALVNSHRPSIVTFPLSLRVSEILPLLCSSTPLFPTPSLVSSKFSHVPLGVDGWRLGYEERRFGLIVHAISFQDFQCAPNPPTLQTYGWTDRRTTCNRNTALCTIVHRAVIIE